MDLNQKSVLFVFLMSLAVFSPAFAAEDGKFSEKLMAIEARLNRIEMSQKEILENDSKIKAELQTLKIWIHKHP